MYFYYLYFCLWILDHELIAKQTKPSEFLPISYICLLCFIQYVEILYAEIFTMPWMGLVKAISCIITKKHIFLNLTQLFLELKSFKFRIYLHPSNSFPY